ncbi:MAG: hypothetical protein Q9195_001681 [Heterodermia aff. obscurata]
MALNSKKRSIADIDDGVGPFKKLCIETTPATSKEGEEALVVTVAAKRKVDIDGEIAELEAEAGEKVEELKKASGTTEDASTSLLEEKNEKLIARGDLNCASEPTFNEMDVTKFHGGIQEEGVKVVATDGEEQKAQTTQTVTDEARATSEVSLSPQASPSRSHKPHRHLRPLRQYPGLRIGHLYKPYAVTLLDGTTQIVWRPKSSASDLRQT